MKLYDYILQETDIASVLEEHIRVACEHLDWSEVEYSIVEEVPLFSRYVDTTNGIDVYYNYGADYYLFIEEE